MRRLLLLTASIIAISAASTSARAEDGIGGAPPSWYFSAEGGPVFGNSTVSDGPDFIARNDLGLNGAVAFGRRFDPLWDWRISLALTRFRDGVASDGFTTLTSRLELGTADLEFGHRHPSSGDPLVELRLFGGLRALYSKDSVDKIGFSEDHWNSQYAGIGPRIGAGFERRMPDSPWGVSGTVAGSAIVGTRDATDKNGTLTTTETVLNLEGALGLDYHTSETSKLTIGARAQQWWNLRPPDRTGDLTVDRDALSWGPFVKFEVKM